MDEQNGIILFAGAVRNPGAVVKPSLAPYEETYDEYEYETFTDGSATAILTEGPALGFSSGADAERVATEATPEGSASLQQ